MTNYRAYLLNGQGRIVGAEDIECMDDEAASEAARALAKDCPVELWQRARLIGRFDPS